VDSSKVSAWAGIGAKTKRKKRVNPRSWQRVVLPHERDEMKFCLADTGLKDDDITPANQAWEWYKPLAFHPFEDLSPTLARIREKYLRPHETISGRARPSE
jgi:hypothetical protein